VVSRRAEPLVVGKCMGSYEASALTPPKWAYMFNVTEHGEGFGRFVVFLEGKDRFQTGKTYQLLIRETG